MGTRPPAPPPPGDEPDGLFSSSLARAGEHFSARDRAEADSVERWATRLGRALSLAAFVVLAWSFGHQLKWW